MAVGKTKEGESLPAKPGTCCYYEWRHVLPKCLIPSFEYPVPLQESVSTQLQSKGPQAARSLLVHDNGGGLRRHLCGCGWCAHKLGLFKRGPLAMVRVRKRVRRCVCRRWDGGRLEAPNQAPLMRAKSGAETDGGEAGGKLFRS